MMTNKMRFQLKKLGYDQHFIKNLKPEEAWEIINKK